jgi:uncharacterized damage-inducible protein DinB
MNRGIKQLIDELHEIQEGRPWIGSNFKQKLKALNGDAFFKRPIPQMHSAAELISHLTTWRKETALKLKTGRGSITDSDPSNWKPLNSLRRKGRQNLMNEYEGSLKEICDLLNDKEDEFLEQTYYDNDFKENYTNLWLLRGMIHHDLYHLGQIGYIVKFLKNSK